MSDARANGNAPDAVQGIEGNESHNQPESRFITMFAHAPDSYESIERQQAAFDAAHHLPAPDGFTATDGLGWSDNTSRAMRNVECFSATISDVWVAVDACQFVDGHIEDLAITLDARSVRLNIEQAQRIALHLLRAVDRLDTATARLARNTAVPR